MKSIPQFRSRRLMAGAAFFLAAGMLVGSGVPSGARRPGRKARTSGSAEPSTTAGFYRHFWRGTQLSQRSVRDGEMTAVADDAETVEAYCMNRFKSYDPASGTYLGYDGNEHPCP